MIIDIFLPLSLVFIMFTLGLGLTTADFTQIIREPKAFTVGILNQMIILPVVAFLIVSFLGLTEEMAVGMMILACCPGGVTSNMITKLAKGDTALSISYTAVMSITTVITLPLITGFSIAHFMGADAPLCLGGVDLVWWRKLIRGVIIMTCRATLFYLPKNVLT